jgi:hypothetical protein
MPPKVLLDHVCQVKIVRPIVVAVSLANASQLGYRLGAFDSPPFGVRLWIVMAQIADGGSQQFTVSGFRPGFVAAFMGIAFAFCLHPTPPIPSRTRGAGFAVESHGLFNRFGLLSELATHISQIAVYDAIATFGHPVDFVPAAAIDYVAGHWVGSL